MAKRKMCGKIKEAKKMLKKNKKNKQNNSIKISFSFGSSHWKRHTHTQISTATQQRMYDIFLCL